MPGIHYAAGGADPPAALTPGTITFTYVTGEQDMPLTINWPLNLPPVPELGIYNAMYRERRAAEEAYEREMQRARERQREWQREYDRSRQRALALLEACLTSGQYASYTSRGWFDLTSSRGRPWRIYADSDTGNVVSLAGHQWHGGRKYGPAYCAHPAENLPLPDVHLAQALALITDEDQFVRVAIPHGQRAL